MLNHNTIKISAIFNTQDNEKNVLKMYLDSLLFFLYTTQIIPLLHLSEISVEKTFRRMNRVNSCLLFLVEKKLTIPAYTLRECKTIHLKQFNYFFLSSVATMIFRIVQLIVSYTQNVISSENQKQFYKN